MNDENIEEEHSTKGDGNNEHGARMENTVKTTAEELENPP